MKTLAFTLSMPSVTSWNGKWSGEGNCYAILHQFTDKIADELLTKPRHTYGFSDGWVAAVSIKEVDAVEAVRLRKLSRGFCGYDWMVDTILTYGRIMDSAQLQKYYSAKNSEKVGTLAR